MSCSCDCTSVSGCPTDCVTATPCVAAPINCNQCLRTTEPQQLGWVPKDVGGMFVAASNAVSAPTLKKTNKIQLFPGDMYQTCPDACAFLVSNDQAKKFQCIPLRINLFVVGPLICDKQLMVVLLMVQQPTDSGQTCTSMFGLYSPCSSTVRLRNNTAFTLDGTNTRFGFRANLPLAGMTGCQALSSVRAELSLQSACDTAMQALFDKALNFYMTQSGFVHMVDWTCLLRLKLLGTGGLLPDSSTSYISRLKEDPDSTTYPTCPSCSTETGNSCDCCSSGTTWTACSSTEVCEE